jgi:hypothetical protein
MKYAIGMLLTISSAPRITPQRILLNQSPPSSASSGSSTNSARGFSSSVNVKYEPDIVCDMGCEVDAGLGEGGGCTKCVTVGVILRKDLKPTYLQFRGNSVKK